MAGSSGWTVERSRAASLLSSESFPGFPGEPGPVILVVDDDPVLLQLFKLVFQRSGFQVLTANSGRDAINIYQSCHETIDLVLLDVCMPGQDGPSTLRKLQRINSSILACFISGHSPDYTPQELLDRGAIRFFPKPYPTDKLTREIHSILGNRLAAAQ